MFGLGAFVLAVVAEELWRGVRARRAMADESVPQALVMLVARNRRRYGGYIVHAGIAVLFVGIAASSTFRDVRDVRLTPGQSAEVGGAIITYTRPTGNIVVARNGGLERIQLGAEVEVRRGDDVRVLRPGRSYFPANDGSAGAISRYFAGESTSEIGLDTGVRRDFWTSVAPETDRLDGIAKRGDAVFKQAESLPEGERAVLLGQALERMVGTYRDSAPPATFRTLVSPLVTWIWVGALIVFTGGLICLWPVPEAARRRVRAGYAARLARELGRA
jgi:cytochrome c-type biogenesis protein CcmF